MGVNKGKYLIIRKIMEGIFFDSKPVSNGSVCIATKHGYGI